MTLPTGHRIEKTKMCRRQQGSSPPALNPVTMVVQQWLLTSEDTTMMSADHVLLTSWVTNLLWDIHCVCVCIMAHWIHSVIWYPSSCVISHLELWNDIIWEWLERQAAGGAVEQYTSERCFFRPPASGWHMLTTWHHTCNSFRSICSDMSIKEGMHIGMRVNEWVLEIMWYRVHY